MFFGLRHCGRRCCAIFVKEFWLFLGPELFFNESLCLFGFSTIERRFSMRVFFLVAKRIESGFFNDSVCFLVSGLLKIDFWMKVFAFLVSGIVEDGAVHFFHLIFFFNFWRPELFFNEGLCFFGFRPFQLLAISWFWWLLFLIKVLIKK